MRYCLHCGAHIEGSAFCTQCGTPAGAVERPLDAPTALTAEVGPAPHPALPSALPSAPATAPAAGAPLPPPPITEVAVVAGGERVGPTDAAVRRMRRRRLGFAAAGVLVAGGVAGVAVAALSDAPAGAATGSDAVSTFLHALAAEDALAAVDAVAPSELRTVRSLVDEATDAADGTGDAADAAREQGVEIDPDDLVPGLEVQLTNLEEHEVELASTVHRVDLRSLDVSWSFDPRALLDMFDVSQLTDGQMTRDDLLEQMGDLDTSDGSFDERDLVIDGVDPFLMTVEEGGSWYVSPAYTVLEYIRQLQDLPAADFDEPTGRGAPTQAAAIETTIEAWGHGDVRGMIEALPPSSYHALYAYRDALAELAGASGTGVDVDATVTLDETETFDDDRGTGVRITKGTIEIAADDGFGTTTVQLVMDGNCVQASVTSDEPVLDRDSDPASGDGAGSTEVCLDHFSDDPDVPFHGGIPGIDSFWLVMDEEDGGWYLDPVGSVVSWIDAVDTDAVRAELERFVDQLGDLQDQLDGTGLDLGA